MLTKDMAIDKSHFDEFAVFLPTTLYGILGLLGIFVGLPAMFSRDFRIFRVLGKFNIVS